MFTLENAGGARARIMNRGGTVVALDVPDRAGRRGDVVLGFDDLAGYLGGGGYLGALIGRYGNRLAGAQFALDGVVHRLAGNDPGNHPHGAPPGLPKGPWTPPPPPA